MPPKAKFTKSEIVEAALSIARSEGFEALTARALGERLESSARPLFTVFRSMDEIRQAVIAAARAMYKEYIRRGLLETPAFKGVGTQYILFSVNEPKLFRLLFMNEYADTPTLSSVLPIIDENYNAILASVKDGYGLSRETAERLYRHLWIYTHGIAALCATNTCRFTGEEIDTMMTEVFIGLLKSLS
ncbi:MAG: TetR/AcrR family transcriptional regulator [Lachnospiraceae bacterium]|nr:TetR/AcrR family transcriptional regulator [Ruminococcus sp.]MCM1275559.1 TetR/AcrR family transcriptional regulator [Lachnospiraceae bacterium]